jgi:hypothetical protein
MHEAAPMADQENLRLGSGHDEPFFHASGPPSHQTPMANLGLSPGYHRRLQLRHTSSCTATP